MPDVTQITSQALSALLAQTQGTNPDLVLESFGFFLEDYVILGGDLTLDSNTEGNFTTTEAVISFNDKLYRAAAKPFTIREFGASTYFLDFTEQNGLMLNKTHPTIPYLPLWTINTNASGGISSTTDNRGAMGFIRFRSEIDGIIEPTINVDESQIANDSVSSQKIRNNAITTAKVADGAISGAKIQDGAITAAKLSLTAIGTGIIVDGAISTAKLGNGAVTTEKLASQSVGMPNIKDKAVGRAQLADVAVGTNQIEDNAVTEPKIASGAIVSRHIADGAITGAKFASGAIGEDRLLLNYRTAELAQSIAELQGSSADSEVVNARGGYPNLDARMDAIQGLTLNTESFISTANQTVFTLVGGSYTPGTNHLRVTVGGLLQSDFTETSSTSFTLDTPLIVGVEVIAEYYTSAIEPRAKHAAAHMRGGSDEISLEQLRGAPKYLRVEHQGGVLVATKSGALVPWSDFGLSSAPTFDVATGQITFPQQGILDGIMFAQVGAADNGRGTLVIPQLVSLSPLRVAINAAAINEVNFTLIIAS